MATDDLGRAGRRNRLCLDESPGNQREKKITIDKEARRENRELLVKLNEAAPQIKQMLEAFNNVNIGELKEEVGAMLSVLRDGTQEIKVLLEEINKGLREAATMAPQCNQNFWQQFQELGETPACSAAPSYPARFNCSFYEEMYKFFEEWDGNTKREGSISDFPGLQEETNEYDFPPSLLPIKTRITEVYGDITQDMRLSNCAARPTIIKFYATVKYMDLTQVEDVSWKKLTHWRDAIMDAKQIGLGAAFAEDLLKRIAHAYVASKEDQMKELQVEYDRIGKMVEKHQWSRSQAQHFQPLNAALFPDPYLCQLGTGWSSPLGHY